MELGAQTVGGTAGPGKTQKTHVPKTNSIIMRYQEAGRGCKQEITVTRYTLKTLLYGGGEMTQSVNGLPHKQEDLSSILQHPCKNSPAWCF